MTIFLLLIIVVQMTTQEHDSELKATDLLKMSDKNVISINNLRKLTNY